jgi:hypothetical protein
MIPQIQTSYYPDRKGELPPPPRDAEGLLFDPVCAPLRKIVVMVDASLLASDSASWTPIAALTDLLEHPYVVCHPYREAEPEPGVPVVAGHNLRDWVAWERDQRVTIRCSKATRTQAEPSHESLTQALTLEDQVPGIRASKAAAGIGADIYITERDYLLNAKRWLIKNCYGWAAEPACYGTLDALALLGLYLRSQGEYTGLGQPTSGVLARKKFYWTAARIAVPECWRWSAAFPRSPDHDSGRNPAVFVTSIAHRIESSLQFRDAMHQALKQDDQDWSTAEVFMNFDACLLFLLGALDASAQAVHRILSAERTNVTSAKWQNKRWRGHLRNDPNLVSLAEAVDKGTTGGHVLTILKTLRNTIHSESLRSRSMNLDDHYTCRPFFRLGPDERAELVPAIRALGTDEEWGIQKSNGNTFADPGLLLERLFPLVLDLLNDLMQHTPVKVPARAAPKGGHEPRYVYPEEVTLSIRWQLGL